MTNERPQSGTPLRSSAEILTEKMAIHTANRERNFPERANAPDHPMKGVSALLGIQVPSREEGISSPEYDLSNFDPLSPYPQSVSRKDPQTGLYGPSELI